MNEWTGVQWHDPKDKLPIMAQWAAAAEKREDMSITSIPSPSRACPSCKGDSWILKSDLSGFIINWVCCFCEHSMAVYQNGVICGDLPTEKSNNDYGDK